MQRQGEEANACSQLLKQITGAGAQIEGALGSKQDRIGAVSSQQQAAAKSNNQQKRSEPAKHSVRKEAECQHAFQGVEAFQVCKKRLVIAGANSDSSSKLSRQRWGNFLDCHGFRIINDSIALQANFQCNLEIFYDGMLVVPEKRPADGYDTAVA